VENVTLNNPKRPFTVWCSIDDSGKCSEIFRLAEDKLAPLGFPRETRKFTPHATLARIKAYDPSLSRVIGSIRGKSYGTCTIAGIRLKKSTLTPRGPLYEDLLEVSW
jgi:2'-5' RNA ligase